MNARVAADANAIHSSLSEHRLRADLNLEGTYIIRVFAVFDATLSSYDRHHFQDETRQTKASVMIDQLGALLRVPLPILAGAHRARRVRNFRAHELEDDPGPMSMERVRGYLQTYLNRFPDEWP